MNNYYCRCLARKRVLQAAGLYFPPSDKLKLKCTSYFKVNFHYESLPALHYKGKQYLMLNGYHPETLKFSHALACLNY